MSLKFSSNEYWTFFDMFFCWNHCSLGLYFLSLSCPKSRWVKTATATVYIFILIFLSMSLGLLLYKLCLWFQVQLEKSDSLLEMHLYFLIPAVLSPFPSCSQDCFPTIFSSPWRTFGIFPDLIPCLNRIPQSGSN